MIALPVPDGPLAAGTCLQISRQDCPPRQSLQAVHNDTISQSVSPIQYPPPPPPPPLPPELIVRNRTVPDCLMGPYCHQLAFMFFWRHCHFSGHLHLVHAHITGRRGRRLAMLHAPQIRPDTEYCLVDAIAPMQAIHLTQPPGCSMKQSCLV